MRRWLLQSSFRFLRHLAVPITVLLLASGGALAQSGDNHANDQQGKPPSAADAAKENQRKTDEFAEAAQAISGPAGNPECVWLGRRVVSLMWRDDLDTAFRCLTRFLTQIDDKVPNSLNNLTQACWINPAAQPQQTAAAASPSPAPTNSNSQPPQPAASPAPAASPTPAPQK